MIATEPLPGEVWDELGWRDGLLIADRRHLFFYAQRTADGRIAIGGRGAPYRLGSPIDQEHERTPRCGRAWCARCTGTSPPPPGPRSPITGAGRWACPATGA